MKRHISWLIILTVLTLVSSARAQTSGFLLAQGPGKLVDSLIAAGYGPLNLYETLQQIVFDTNPSVAGVITPTFLAALHACPAGSAIFTTTLSAYAGSGVVVYADCTAAATGLQGSGFNGLAGSSTLSTVIADVSAGAALVSMSPAYGLDSTHSVFGILYAPQGPSQSIVLSNESPGHLIANLLAAGYGSMSLYDTLVQIVSDTNPSVSGVITPAFLQHMRNCPVGSQAFTTQLNTIAGPAVAVSDDCSLQSVSLQGSTFNGQPGTTTLATDISGVGPASAVSANPVTSWTQSIAVGSGTATVTYNAIGILYTPGSAPPATPAPPSLWLAITGCLLLLGYALWSRRRAAVLPLLLLSLAALPARAIDINVNQATLVISNEGTGFLITKLINAGHGGDSISQVVQFLAGLPGADAAIPPSFVPFFTPWSPQNLDGCPPGAPTLTATLAQYSAASAIAISTGCTVQSVNIGSSPYAGQSGTTTVEAGNGAVQNVRIVYKTDGQTPLTQWTAPGPLAGMTTTYSVLFIAWALPDSPAATPAPPSLWLALTGCLLLLGYALWSRRRAAVLPLLLLSLAAVSARAQVQSFALAQGPGKLVDSLIAAGYGDFSLYQALLAIRDNANPSVAGVLTPSFLNTLASCPAGSQIFTNHLSAYAGSAALVSTDCTAVPTRFANGSGQNGAAGTTTLAFALTGVSAPAAIVSSATPFYVLDATGDFGCVTPSTCHNVFAIAYAPQGPSQTFVLSDEAPGRLITNLVAAGWGDYNLYDALIALQANSNPSLAGVITDDFLRHLAGCAAGKPVFTTQLKNVTGTVAISDDCSVQSRNLQGSAFSGQPGITTRVYDLSGIGPATTVSSTGPQTPLNSWSQNVTVGASTATVTHSVFVILYTPGSSPPAATPAPPSLILVATGGLALLGRRLWRRRRA